MVRPAERLGDPEPRRRAKDDPDRARDVDEMPRGDEKRLDPRPGPDDGADSAPSEAERGAAAPLSPGLVVFADEAGLGAPDRRDTEKDTEMRGDAQAAGMGYPLAIDQDEIGGPAKVPEGVQNGRPLAEGKKARDIGKAELSRRHRVLDRLERREGEEARRRDDLTPLEGGVNPGDKANSRA